MRGLRLILVMLLSCSVVELCPAEPSGAGSTNAVANGSSEASDSSTTMPPPLKPWEAFLKGQHGTVELTITAARDGVVREVVVSKSSNHEALDKSARLWVQSRWKMPGAKPGDPELRRFIVPIVYPKDVWSAGGKYPNPLYPPEALRHRQQGTVMLYLKVRSGHLDAIRILQSSGHEILDAITVAWIRERWEFPPDAEGEFMFPCTFRIN